jgi:hypothetical protein
MISFTFSIRMKRSSRNLIRRLQYVFCQHSFFFYLQEKKNLFEEFETTKNQYAQCNNEVIRLQELVDHLQTDKTKLSRRVSKLVHNGNDFVFPKKINFFSFLKKKNYYKNYKNVVARRKLQLHPHVVVHYQENLLFQLELIFILKILKMNVICIKMKSKFYKDY